MSNEKRSRRRLVMLLAVGAFALFVSGIWSDRRDPLLDGTYLYAARIAHLATCFVAAWLFRNHLPSVQRFALTAGGFFAFSLLLCAISSFAAHPAPLEALAQVAMGVAHAGIMLLSAHLFSSYEPRVSAALIATAYLLTEILFSSTLLAPNNLVGAVSLALKISGVALLAAALTIRLRASSEDWGRPLQFGIAQATNPEADQHPLRFLASGSDWIFQAIAATLIPFAFGFTAQFVSSGPLADGFHDAWSELAAIVALMALTIFCAARRGRIGFNALFCTVVFLYGTGFMLLPTLWESQSPFSGALIKCAITLYQPLLWIMLARKSYEDPRHTYLYFGIFVGLANVTYGRILEPILMGNRLPDLWSLTGISIFFLWAFLVYCLTFFMLQRTVYAIGASSGRKEDCASSVSPDTFDPFFWGIGSVCTEAQLTPREREVLIEILHGYSMSNVAENLCISPETVRTHMKNIYQKTHTTNKQALVRRIDKRGKQVASERKQSEEDCRL